MRVAVDVDPYDVPEPAGETVGPYDVSKAVAGMPVPTHGGSKPPALHKPHRSEQKLREDQGPPLPTKASKFRFAIQTYGCRFVTLIQIFTK